MNIATTMPPGQSTFPALQAYPRNQWYVAAFSSEVSDRGLLRRVFLEMPVVLYRTAGGKVAALHDRCPHRGLPLSLGKVKGDGIQCGYHGIEFGMDGACTHIPSQTGTSSSLKVRSYPVIETWQWIWIWMGDPAKADPGLLPDHEWLGLTRDDLDAQPYFRMEIGANYQFMHDNLLDSTHTSFLHAGSFDNEDEMASAKLTIEEEGQSLRISYDTPGIVFSPPVAKFFGVVPGKPYDRVLVNETFAPSVSIGKQRIVDPVDPAGRAVELYAINAVTPASQGQTHLIHVEIASFDRGPADRDMAKAIVMQDKVALESMQRDFERFGDIREVSLRADNMGIRCRRIIEGLVRSETA